MYFEQAIARGASGGLERDGWPAEGSEQGATVVETLETWADEASAVLSGVEVAQLAKAATKVK